MMWRIVQLISVLTSLCLWMSCANEVAPQGGPKDTAAPKLANRTIQDSSLNFKGGKVEFEFDEKIDPRNIFVETFPLMKSAPNVSVNKKTLVLNIPDSLLEANTTYKISLGNSIKDIYEGNAYNSLSFSFSTGSYLDTLQINGNVINASNGNADTSAWVFLYPTINNDSDIVKIKPLYASKVDATGAFKINNLPNREFFVYAIGDINKNYKYDFALENIAYLPSTIIPIDTVANLKLYTFLEDNSDSTKKNVKSNARGGIATVPRFKINIDSTNAKTRSFDITQAIMITFANKLKNWDATKIRLLEDNLLDQTGILMYDSNANKITLNIDYSQDANYSLQLLDSFAIDTSYFKSAIFNFKTKKENDYGTLKVKYNQIFNDYNHIIQLYQNENLIAKQTINDSIINFKLLNPGNYIIRILHDVNNNSKWDGGKYLGGKQQPEHIEKYASDVIIKANWLNALDWDEKKKR